MVYENTYFKLVHCRDCFIAGYLILLPKQEVTSIAELLEPAQQQLGPTLAIAQRVLQTVINPQKIYSLSFNEKVSSLHFHIFPRTQELLAEYLAVNDLQAGSVDGPLLVTWARDTYQARKQIHYSELIEQINKEFAKITH